MVIVWSKWQYHNTWFSVVFATIPRAGEFVEDDRGDSHNVLSVTHCMLKEGNVAKPFIRVELEFNND